jgi:hypothetical protein
MISREFYKKVLPTHAVPEMEVRDLVVYRLKY